MFTIILFMLLCALQVADIITTNKAVRVGGEEVNPVVKWFMNKFGNWWPLVKIPSIAIFTYWAEVGAWLPLLIFIVVYTYVCYHNYKIWRK